MTKREVIEDSLIFITNDLESYTNIDFFEAFFGRKRLPIKKEELIEITAIGASFKDEAELIGVQIHREDKWLFSYPDGSYKGCYLGSYSNPHIFETPIEIDGNKFSCWGIDITANELPKDECKKSIPKRDLIKMIVKYKIHRVNNHARNDEYYNNVMKELDMEQAKLMEEAK